jgi:hypothetical protein
VVAHQAIGKDAYFDAFSALFQNRDERGKIAGLSKNIHAAVAAIHHMINGIPPPLIGYTNMRRRSVPLRMFLRMFRPRGRPRKETVASTDTAGRARSRRRK